MRPIDAGRVPLERLLAAMGWPMKNRTGSIKTQQPIALLTSNTP
jgi:hypothetical protein